MKEEFINFVGPQVVWIRVFAWQPVRINKHWYWLRSIYRRERNKYVYPHQGYEYGTLFDVIRDL